MKHFNYSVMIASVLTMVFSLLPLHALAGSQWSNYGEDGFIVDGLAYGKLDDGKSVCVTALLEWDDHYGTQHYPGLTEAIIPETVTYEGVTYTVTEIDDFAFCDFNSMLRKVVIPNTVTKIGEGAFTPCKELESLTIGDGVLLIDQRAFEDCSSLVSVVLPDKLSAIGDAAFRWCYNLKTVIIGKSVMSMGTDVFSGCSKLNDVYCHLMNPQATQYPAYDYESIFYEVPLASCTLHIPIGTRELYEQCDPWNDFGTIVEDLEPDADVDPWVILPMKRVILEAGQQLQLVEPLVNPSDMELTWTSSDESVATIDSDLMIKAIAPGMATITVTGDAPNKPTATCEVTVKEPPAPDLADDVNGDGVVDIADVDHVIRTMLNKRSR